MSTALTSQERRLDARISQQFSTFRELLQAGKKDDARSAWKVYAGLVNRRTVDHQNKLCQMRGLPVVEAAHA